MRIHFFQIGFSIWSISLTLQITWTQRNVLIEGERISSGRQTQQGYRRSVPKRSLHPHTDAMLQKSIWDCETGQNEISARAIREIKLAGRQKHATKSPGTEARRVVSHLRDVGVNARSTLAHQQHGWPLPQTLLNNRPAHARVMM